MTEKFKSIGDDVFVDPGAYIKWPQLISIGSHTALDNGLHMTTSGSIGSYVHIGPHVSIIGGKNSTFCAQDFSTVAAGARIICKGEEHLGAGLIGPTIPEEYSDKLIGGVIVLERFANVLSNAIVFPGIKIGEGAVIGAGCVMNRDAEPWTIYLGNPARKIKTRDKDKMISLAEKLISNND